MVDDTMKRHDLSARGAALIKGWEGCELDAYRDQCGVWTIGWGHTGPEVHEGLRWDQATADQTFKLDTQWAIDTVNECVKVPLSQAKFDALVCLVYNIGRPNFVASTLLRRLNKFDYSGAQEQFQLWNKIRDRDGNLVRNAGLTNRRAAEAQMFGELT